MNETLTVPRKLAQQLFHLAQTGVASGWVSRESSGNLSAAAGPPPTDERPFAVWYNHPQGPVSPHLHEQHAEAWTFVIALDTKGVLQLHAWRGTPQREFPVKILRD